MVCSEPRLINYKVVMRYLRDNPLGIHQGHKMQHHHTVDGQTAQAILSAYATQALFSGSLLPD